MIFKTTEQLVNDLLRDGNLHMWNRPHPSDYFNRNMKIEDDVLSMEFDVPGLSKKDISVKVEDNILSIAGENDSRTFNKSYKISEDWDVSKTSAETNDGVLTISIPKLEEKKAKVIEVKVK